MPSCTFTRSARLEIIEIVAAIRDDNPSAAERWFSQLEEKCRTLAGSPGIGRVRDDLLPSVYMFPFGSYLIFYDIAANGIQVVHVVHSARDVRRTFAPD